MRPGGQGHHNCISMGGHGLASRLRRSDIGTLHLRCISPLCCGARFCRRRQLMRSVHKHRAAIVDTRYPSGAWPPPSTSDFRSRVVGRRRSRIPNIQSIPRHCASRCGRVSSSSVPCFPTHAADRLTLTTPFSALRRIIPIAPVVTAPRSAAAELARAPCPQAQWFHHQTLSAAVRPKLDIAEISLAWPRCWRAGQARCASNPGAKSPRCFCIERQGSGLLVGRGARRYLASRRAAPGGDRAIRYRTAHTQRCRSAQAAARRSLAGIGGIDGTGGIGAGGTRAGPSAAARSGRQPAFGRAMGRACRVIRSGRRRSSAIARAG